MSVGWRRSEEEKKLYQMPDCIVTYFHLRENLTRFTIPEESEGLLVV